MSIRIHNFFYKKKYSYGTLNEKIVENNNFKIVAFGNSFTLGSGAPPGESYPDHLQRRFIKELPNIKVDVINRGIGGANSAIILRMLKKVIKKTIPDLMIFRVGEQNYSNLTLISDYLNRENIQQNFLSKTMNYIHDKLFFFRLYRLLFYLDDKRESEKMNILIQVPADEWRNKRMLYQRKFKKFGDKNFQNFCNNKKEIDELEKWFVNETQTTPNASNYFWLGMITQNCRQDNLKAARLFILGIENATEYKYDRSYEALVNIRTYDGTPQVQSLINNFIERWSKNYPDTKYFLDTKNKMNWESWVRSDVTEILRIAKEYNITVVMHNYPPDGERFPERKTLNKMLKDIALKNNIIFFDFEKTILDMMTAFPDKNKFIDEYFAKDLPSHPMDGHLNSKGNKLNADHLFDLIMKHKLVHRPKKNIIQYSK